MIVIISNVIISNVIISNVIISNVILRNVIARNVIIRSVIIRNVIIRNVLIRMSPVLSVIIISFHRLALLVTFYLQSKLYLCIKVNVFGSCLGPVLRNSLRP